MRILTQKNADKYLQTYPGGYTLILGVETHPLQVLRERRLIDARRLP